MTIAPSRAWRADVCRPGGAAHEACRFRDVDSRHNGANILAPALVPSTRGRCGCGPGWAVATRAAETAHVTADADTHGPWLQTAVFAQAVCGAAGASFTITNITDRIAVEPDPQPCTLVGEERRLPVRLVISLKSGGDPAGYTLIIRQVDPDGVQRGQWMETLLLDGPGSTHQLVLSLSLKYYQDGLHWFDVLVDGRRLTRMSLRFRCVRSGSAERRSDGVAE